ncbi:ZIP family metal transporter [Candidatus Woesearchaeota archaeon]|nr:ZIP family metal transporter [Candidatus Woesearchaeota archaeon]
MNVLIWILAATIVDSLLGLIGVFSLWMKEKLLNKIIIALVAFSAGALLGGAFFHLLDESLIHLSSMVTFSYVIIGFMLFFLIESYFHLHLYEKTDKHPFSYLAVIGDAIHNFIDGLVIAAAFYINITLGIVTTVMIMGHEAPQEMGLFGILLYGKHSKSKALLYSFLAQSTVILGGVVGYFTSARIEAFSPFLIAFAAGGFIYIAASDLVPEMHKMYEGKISRSITVTMSFVVGILLMLVIKLYFGG